MKATGIVLAAALLAAGSAQAQSSDAPSSRLQAEAKRFGPLAAGFKRYEPVYGGNETANPNDRLFPGFRTDPRLVIGYSFSQYLALETGYAHLRDEGFHKIDPASPVEQAVAAGALGARSHTTYVAAKITVPVTDRLTAYGRFGIAHSVVKNDGFVTPEQVAARSAGKAGAFVGETGTGPYGAVGARYKLNDRATFNGEVRVNDSASKFGAASNASAVHGSVGIGF